MTGLTRVLSVEFRRAFGGKNFLIICLIGVGLAAWHVSTNVLGAMRNNDQFVPGKGAYPLSLYDGWMGTNLSGRPALLLSVLFPLLASIPYGASLAADRRSGYDINMVTRTSRSQYYLARQVTAFCIAGVSVVIPYLLDFLAAAALLPALRPVPELGSYSIGVRSMWADVFYGQPLLYVLGYLAIIFLWSGCLGLIPLVVGFFVKNRIVVLMSSFLLLVIVEVMVIIVDNFANARRFSPLSFMRPDQPARDISLAIIAAEWLVAMGAVVGFLMVRARRDEAL